MTTSSDLTFSEVAALLASDGLDATVAGVIVTWLEAHSPEATSGLAPVETI